MKKKERPSEVESLIRNSGFVVTKDPSPEHPTAIILSYRSNADGTVCWVWPQGSRHTDFFKRCSSTRTKWITVVNRICSAFGIGSLIAEGRLKLYTDLPTASYIVNEWHL